jgi:hypothetical protein
VGREGRARERGRAVVMIVVVVVVGSVAMVATSMPTQEQSGVLMTRGHLLSAHAAESTNYARMGSDVDRNRRAPAGFRCSDGVQIP